MSGCKAFRSGPSERTEIRVVFDEDNLYIGAIIYDDPEGVLAFQRERDAPLGTDDRFMWILDTFLDGRPPSLRDRERASWALLYRSRGMRTGRPAGRRIGLL